jgi:hypothetical protein
VGGELVNVVAHGVQGLRGRMAVRPVRLVVDVLEQATQTAQLLIIIRSALATMGRPK